MKKFIEELTNPIQVTEFGVPGQLSFVNEASSQKGGIKGSMGERLGRGQRGGSER